MKAVLTVLIVLIGLNLSAQSDKPIKFFSLIGLDQNAVESIIGKPTKSTLVHRGTNSYDGFLYKTTRAEYSVCYRNGNAFMVAVKPISSQKFSEDALFDGGAFDIENDRISGAFRPISGREADTQYYGFSNGSNGYTFYGRSGKVTRALAF